jgi:hypothetical protein
MTLEEVLSILSEFFLIKDWEKNGSGEYSVVVDNKIDVSFIPVEKTHVVFQGCFGDALPNSDAAEAKLKRLLQWNFARVQHNNDVLSVDQKSRRISVFRRISFDKLTMDSLLDHVDSFVRNVDFWLSASESKRVAVGLSPLLNRFHLK